MPEFVAAHESVPVKVFGRDGWLDQSLILADIGNLKQTSLPGKQQDHRP
jgi:hypothetical protein